VVFIVGTEADAEPLRVLVVLPIEQPPESTAQYLTARVVTRLYSAPIRTRSGLDSIGWCRDKRSDA
jgi:hypothetical protein